MSAGASRHRSRSAATATRVTLALLHQEDDNIRSTACRTRSVRSTTVLCPACRRVRTTATTNVDTQEIGRRCVHGDRQPRVRRDIEPAQSDALAASGSVLARQPAPRYVVRRDGHQSVDGCGLCTTPPAPSCRTAAAPHATRRTRFSSIRRTSRVEFATAGVQHTLVTGFSLSEETYHRDNGNALRNPLGATPNPVLPAMSIADPDHFYTGPVNFIVTQRGGRRGQEPGRVRVRSSAAHGAIRDQRGPPLRAQRCLQPAREHRRAVSGAAGPTRRDADSGREQRRRPVPRIASASSSSRARTRASTSRTATRRRRRRRP